MKTLLVGINASYSHTCLAVRSICQYVKCNSNQDISFQEFTINQPVGEILRGIAAGSPDLVLFSTYIWNAEITAKVIPDVKKILPEAVVGAGGPEFGYASQKYFSQLPDLDFIMFGEGELTVKEVLEEMQQNHPFESGKLQHIKGLFLRNNQGQSVFTGERELICNLGELPFAYPELLQVSNPLETFSSKMFYYESSRGCPYSCAYCLSSVDKRVRFMPLERVYQDLQIFLDVGVPLVKFVDRTYNLNPDRYISIWDYILQHHNGKTMFHFEIEAEYLSAEALEFLQKMPAGVMQFEIGVQSANKKTLEAVNRSPNVEKLAENIRRIPRTIHQHLDLIAGLPYENLESFGHSLDFVMDLKPDALQLGFLKILHGTQMERYAKNNGWKWMENPVYETFSTPYMSYNDLLFLKDLETVVDAYWNSGVFSHLMNYLGRKEGWWNLFCKIVEFARSKGVFEAARRETYWFNLISQMNLDSVALELLRYDFVLRGKQGKWPDWYDHRYSKERHRQLLEENGGIHNSRVDFGHSEYEVFMYDVDSDQPENHPGTMEKLIRY